MRAAVRQGGAITATNLPKSATILVVRHAEKPKHADDVGLSRAGRARALAYVEYLGSFTPPGGVQLDIDHVFAAANSPASSRPLLTMTPLATALGLPIDDAFADGDYAKLAKYIGGASSYDDAVLLICWHHGHALALAAALGGDLGKGVPKNWPGDVFGWVVMLASDADGELASATVINQKLMYDDHGSDPPD